jgi:flagellar hook-basal body complex protein FliE
MAIELGLMAPLAPLRSFELGETPDLQIGNGGAAKAGTDFAQILSEAWQKVDTLQKDGDLAIGGLVSGQIDDVHTAVIALQKAQLSLSLTVEVRNKMLDAYSEMMRMQI